MLHIDLSYMVPIVADSLAQSSLSSWINPYVTHAQAPCGDNGFLKRPWQIGGCDILLHIMNVGRCQLQNIFRPSPAVAECAVSKIPIMCFGEVERNSRSTSQESNVDKACGNKITRQSSAHFMRFRALRQPGSSQAHVSSGASGRERLRSKMFAALEGLAWANTDVSSYLQC
jgi:hypothetical protein